MMINSTYRSICRSIGSLLYLGCLLFPLWVIYFWWQAPHTPLSWLQDYGMRLSMIPAHMPHPAHLANTSKWLGFAISWIPAAVIEYIGYCLAKLFIQLARGHIFSIQHIRLVRRIAYALFIGQLLHPVYDLMMSATLSWHTSQRVMSISIGLGNLLALVIALLLLVIAQVLLSAEQLAKEHALTI